MAQWVGFTCCLDLNWMPFGLGCMHGDLNLKTAFGMGPVLLALQQGSIVLDLNRLLYCAQCFAVSQHSVIQSSSDLYWYTGTTTS